MRPVTPKRRSLKLGKPSRRRPPAPTARSFARGLVLASDCGPGRGGLFWGRTRASGPGSPKAPAACSGLVSHSTRSGNLSSRPGGIRVGASNGVSGSRKHRSHCLPLPPSTSPTPETGLVDFLLIRSPLVWNARRRRANSKISRRF